MLAPSDYSPEQDSYMMWPMMSTTWCSWWSLGRISGAVPGKPGGSTGRPNRLLAAIAARDAVDLRRPLNPDVENGLIGGGEEVIQPLGATPLELLHQDAAVRQADHAEFADEIGRNLPAHVVIEDEPAVQERSQAVAADLDRDRIFRRSGRIDLVEITLIHLVEVSLGARADIAEHPDLRCGRLVRIAGPHRLASGQQPFRRHPEAARIALGLVGAVVPAAGRFRPLVGAIGRNRDAHGLACQARGFVLLLARDA